jgi:hypothetical protein
MQRWIVVAAVVTLAAAPVVAQPPAPSAAPLSRTTGLVLGANASGMSISTTEGRATTTENGPGGGVLVGWGFSPRVTGIVRYNQAAIAIDGLDGDYTLGQFDIGARLHFRSPTQRARPYLEGYATGRAIQFSLSDGFDRSTLQASGAGLTAGAGVQIHFAPAIAADIGLGLTFGSFGEWKVDGQTVPGVGSVGATGGLFRVGLNFWPIGPKR